MPDTTLSSLPQFWQIWKNPIFIRYRRAKLRLTALITGALLYGGLSLFILLVSMGVTSQHEKMLMTFQEAAIYPFIAIACMQIMTLNFGGTGAVASGMAMESIDDVLTYQRLTPLSPLTKIIGYLAGLPIRQYYHFLTTLPVTVFIILAGKISMEIWLPIYVVLFTSTIMFHLLAMTVGFIMGKKFSMIISQGMVVLLYFAFPQLSKFGFVAFEYLTIRPAFLQSLHKKIPEIPMKNEFSLFFNWEISHIWYSIIIQGLISLIFLAILLRRWRHEHAHLLSKLQSLALCIIAHIFILGGIWANTSSGKIFELNINSRRAEAVLAEHAVQQHPQYVASSIIGIYGIITLALAILLQYLYTPDKFKYFAGIRQRLKDGKSSIAWLSDTASAVPTTILIAIISISAWLFYTGHLISTEKIQSYLDGKSWSVIKYLIIATLAAPLIGHGFALEKWGKKLVGTVALFAWAVPLAVAILGSAWNFSSDIFDLLYGLSPLAMVFSPAYSLTHLDYLMSQPFVVGSLIGCVLYFFLAALSLYGIIHRHKTFMLQGIQSQPSDKSS